MMCLLARPKAWLRPCCLVLARAANLVNFCIEFKSEFKFSLLYEFEFSIFIFASSSSSSSPAKIYQVFLSSENIVIDLT